MDEDTLRELAGQFNLYTDLRAAELIQAMAVGYELGVVTMNEYRKILGLGGLKDGDCVKEPKNDVFRGPVQYEEEDKE